MTYLLATQPSTQPVGLLEAGKIPASDPCSLIYINNQNRHSYPAANLSRMTSVSSHGSQNRRRNIQAKARKALRTVAKSIKKVFHVGSKKTRASFVMPTEFANISRTNSSRSSKRCNRRSARMSSALSLDDIQRQTGDLSNTTHPAIILTSASVRGRTSQYVVHSYEGLDFPEQSPMKKSVRTSHPAVSYVIERPSTPTTIASERTSVVGVDNEWFQNNHVECSPESSPTASDFAGQVQPALIVRRSGVEVDPSTFAKVLNKIDGVKKQAEQSALLTLPSQLNKSTDSLTCLPFVAKAPMLDIHRESQQVQATVGAQIEMNRQSALAALEGPRAPPSKATVVPIRVPSVLKPGPPVVLRKPAAHKRNLTTGDIGTLGDLKQIYLPYNGGFEKLNPFDEPVATVATKSHGKQPADYKTKAAHEETKAQTSSCDSLPNFADHVTHKEHYSRIESGIFDSEYIPDFADSAEQLAHYELVESSIFEGKATLVAVPRPANPEPGDEYSYFTAGTPVSIESSPPTVPNSRPFTHPPSTQPKQHQIKRKSVPNYSKKLVITSADKDKPLPPTPSQKVEKLKMNENGFPVLHRHSASLFSAQAEYKRRSVNEVEAKFMREQAKKLTKKEKLMKQEAEEIKKRKKLMKGQEKAVRKLMLD